MIAEGHFSGKALVITLGSLGLSSAAVRTGVAGLRWVTGLDTARRSGTLARFGIRAGKFANVAGWVYTAAELAVILYVAEKIEHTVNAALELKNAREDLRDASRDVLAALDADTPSEASVEAATRAYHESWIAFRNLLYRPLDMDEALFAQRLAKVAREAKLLEDTRSAAVRRVNSHEGLTSSLERYIDTKARGDHAELSREINRAFEAYTLSRSEHLAEVYEGNVRGTRFLLSSRASGDARLIEAHGDASKNRLESYDDEAAVLAAFAWRARRAGHPELAETFERTRALTLKTRDMDRELFEGGDSVVDVSRPTFDRALGAGR